MQRLAALVVVVVLAFAAGCKREPGPNEPQLVLPTKTKGTASLLFVGDMSVARGITDVIDKQGKGDTAWPFERIKPLFEAHDLVFANLECVISDSTAEEATQKTYRIRAATKYALSLHDVGVDVVSVANNHAMDFGFQGFSSTLATMKKEGVLTVGGLTKDGWDQHVTIVDVGGIRVGFLAYNQHGDEYKIDDKRPTSARYRISDVVDDIKAARPLVDFLVVSVHGGLELNHEADAWQIADSRKAIDAGADLWVGHHPHVAQPYAIYKGKLITYSLGDFLFDKSSPWLVHRNRPRFFLEVNLSKGADGKVVAKHQMLAGDQEDATYRPFLAPGSFDIDSFAEPAKPQKTFRDLLKTATVERVRGDAVTPCDRWEKKRVPTRGHSFRWLAPRWGCAADRQADSKRAWETVAGTSELFQGVLKRGIWAHPNANGPLRMRFPDVALGSKLVGYGGVPDWGVIAEEQAVKKGKPPTPPVNVRIFVEGEDDGPKGKVPDTVTDVVVPYAAGTTPIAIDTAAAKGQKRDVIVEISGGPGDNEGRFVFDLQVQP